MLGAHILGGLLAGGMARRSPGLNGALSAALGPVLLVARPTSPSSSFTT
ncbi:MAG: hypothetical protein AVDCRST_MAG03-183 [uncultured Rubrobacteraceae bacterium]|uniref:Uncharacterized protein n=1 Tax=uncultured Rubrobacteraceae bacterium TaxID=349277 RepID=A0A6J4NGT2_9ACTN|nr:MAG: hypothetical protein AVDCRST_MAG03-183 [uncultured Rubrobacteraceae bacterium]